MTLIEQAKVNLIKENASCSVIRGDFIYTSKDKGVKPILSNLKIEEDFFLDAYVADRVIGKAAALLLVKGKVKEIYGELISEHAIKVLEEYSIPFSYDTKVPYIMNRTHNGMCPLEESVLNITNPSEAYIAICNTVAKLMAAK